MIYHILTETDWRDANVVGRYEAASLESVGFIHCCTKEQFEQVANFYFTGMKGLLALEIEPEKLTAHVKFEGEGEQKFPHIYGAINLDSVVNVAKLKTDEDGVFRFPFKPTLH